MVLEAGENANTDTHPCVSEGRLTGHVIEGGLFDHTGQSCNQTQIPILVSTREGLLIMSAKERLSDHIIEGRLSDHISEGRLSDHAGESSSNTQAKNTVFDHLRSTNTRKRLRRTGFSQTAASLICSSWWSGTSRQYDLRSSNRFQISVMPLTLQDGRYASKRFIHPVLPPMSEGVNFLAMLFRAGLSYSDICVARSL